MLKYGYMEPIWDDSFKKLPFEKQPMMQREIDAWNSQGYSIPEYIGAMYGSKNPMPAWCEKVAEDLGMAKTGFVLYRMDTMDIMPVHTDHFETYMRVFGVEHEDIVRALIFLEDWKSGHYFEANGRAFVNWRAGDYVMWTPDIPHAASNIGIEDRYTLQITGVLV